MKYTDKFKQKYIKELEKNCQEWEAVFLDIFWNPIIDKIEIRVRRLIENDRRQTRELEGGNIEPYPVELLCSELSPLSWNELHWDSKPKFNLTTTKSTWIWHNLSNEDRLIDWLENNNPKDNNTIIK